MTTDRQPVDQSARARTLETNESFLVQAPAGSGKTELLTRRLLKLLAEVDEPEQILAITFTLAATAEMRERVVSALQKARDTEETGEELQLARNALAHDARRGWNLLQQPERLNIRTIDAVCLDIAHQTPLLSRLGGSLSPTDKPQPLYTLAARRGAAEHTGGDRIRHELPVKGDDDQPKACARREIRADGTVRDCAKVLAIGTTRLAQHGTGIRRCAAHGAHHAGVRSVSPAANGQQFLRASECQRCCRRQQCRKNAQQRDGCNPPHAVSVHALRSRRIHSALRYKTRMQFPPAIAAAVEAGDTVIASSARAARALRRLYGEAQRAQGREAWQSPDILDWDSWLNRLWQKRLRSGSETRLLLTTLQEQQIWVQLVKPSIEGRRLISVPGVAELAQQAYALLCAYGALDFLSGERLGGPDVESFREWGRGFERKCRQEDWLSRANLPLVLQEAVLAGQEEAPFRLVLTGFDRVTPAQQDLIDAFREQGHDIALAEPAEISPGQTSLLVEAVDRRDEIATCALWVQRELAAAAARGHKCRIAVVVPGVSRERPEIERAFRQVLAPEAVAIGARDLPLPYEFSLGVSLADVPMARSALLLLRWMHEALLQDQVSWLLLSGFLCEQQDELLAIAEFDVNVRRRAMRQPEQDLDSFLQSAYPPEKLRHRLQAARRLLHQDSALTFAQWVHVADQMLEAVHWPGAHVLESEDFQVQARWSQLLDSLAALAFDGRVVDYAEFLGVLEQQAKQTIFAPESRDAPVQILGPLEAAGLTFDALWFLGADDANWPAVGRPHPFLTRSLQRTHNMPHAESTADWKLAQQVTTRLERSAAQCVFSFPAQNAEGGCRPSTLVNDGKSRVTAMALRISIGANEALPERSPANRRRTSGRSSLAKGAGCRGRGNTPPAGSLSFSILCYPAAGRQAYGRHRLGPGTTRARLRGAQDPGESLVGTKNPERSP